MAKAKKTDKIIQELSLVVQQRKEEISKAEKPNWITNGCFKYSKTTTESFNLQTVTDVNVFVNALAFLLDREKSFNEASEQLGVTGKFDWFGYSVDDWRNDFKTRITKIQIAIKKKELEVIELRLNKLISEDLRTEMELAEITKALS